MRVAILDDYQNAALTLVDWSGLAGKAEIVTFAEHEIGTEAVISQLEGFEIVCVMRERTPLTREVLTKLPRLRLIASTGARNASIDTNAASELGIDIVHTGYNAHPTIELTWALILGSARNLLDEALSVRGGGWQKTVGDGLHGKTLGLLGLGNVGGAVAKIGEAFGMHTIAWSQNLTTERAGEFGVERVEKHELFERSDVLSVHLVLSGRTRGLVDGALLSLMKPTARLVNTSRGPIIVERDMLAALVRGTIAGAAIDVFDIEPLPADHPYRGLPNVLATPHIGYVSKELYRTFYGDALTAISDWIDRR